EAVGGADVDGAVVRDHRRCGDLEAHLNLPAPRGKGAVVLELVKAPGRVAEVDEPRRVDGRRGGVHVLAEHVRTRPLRRAVGFERGDRTGAVEVLDRRHVDGAGGAGAGGADGRRREDVALEPVVVVPVDGAARIDGVHRVVAVAQVEGAVGADGRRRL